MSHAKSNTFNSCLPAKIWQNRQRKNHLLLQPVLAAHRRRMEQGEKNPIVDFMFEYYHFKPSKLLDWSPGIDFVLTGKSAAQFLSKKGFDGFVDSVFVNPALFPRRRIKGLDWTINLLKQTLKRKPVYNCFGLHEWCMIYEKSDIRHPQLPLRLSHSDSRKVVKQHSIQCSHYDAYRFYSRSARQFNKQSLNRGGMAKNEQPGCLHSNMDLYRWAYKYHPWVGSDLIARAFMLALQIRQTDMRASPYDVSTFTRLPAIAIETNEGKHRYIKLQKQYYQTAQIIRKTLLQKLERLRYRRVVT